MKRLGELLGSALPDGSGGMADKTLRLCSHERMKKLKGESEHGEGGGCVTKRQWSDIG